MFGFIKKRHEQYEIGEWYVGWKSWKFELTYKNTGYETDNAELHISMFGWHSLFRLPWRGKTKNDWYYGEKTYGISCHDNALFFHWGHNLKAWELPFVSYGGCIRWEIYSGLREHYHLNRKEDWQTYSYMDKNIKDHPAIWMYDYTDSYDGSVIPCKIYVEEQEWRPKWLRWTKKWAHIKRCIKVDFDEEVGSRKGSWKGGCLGCGYEMLPGEDPIDCIKRMEKERQF